MPLPTTDEVISSFVKPEWKDIARLVATTAEMAERERCASIAENMYLDMIQDKDMRGVRERHEWVCRDIASTIRGTS